MTAHSVWYYHGRGKRAFYFQHHGKATTIQADDLVDWYIERGIYNSNGRSNKALLSHNTIK